MSGVVFERTSGGVRPLAGANVNAWVQSGRFGYSYMWANGPVLSDSDGGYELKNLPDGATVHLQVYMGGMVQQCAAPLMTMDRSLRQDAFLVSRQRLSAEAEGPAAPGFRAVSGVVFELTPDGRVPAAGAFVDYEPIMDFPAATTYADQDGRFLLCGLPDDRPVELGAAARGRLGYLSVPRGTLVVEIDLK